MSRTIQTADDARQKALDQLRAGLTYSGVDSAWRWLAENPEDTAIRGELTAGLSRLGLETLAVHVGSGFSGATGMIPWGKRRAIWSENLKALQSREPELAVQLRELWNSCRNSFELYECADGNFQVRFTGQGTPGMWLPSFADHRLAAEQVRAPGGSFASGNCGMIHGVYFGWLLERAYRETKGQYLEYSCPIYLLAPSGAELAAAMHLWDWREVLSDRRVRLFVGPDCIDSIEAFLCGHLLYPVPAWRVAQPSWDSSRAGELNGVIERTAGRRNEVTLGTHRELEEAYAGRDLAYWAERYARRDGEPLRVLGIVSRHSTFIRGSMEECMRALGSLGCTCRILSEAEPFFLGNSAYELGKVQTEFMPDLILMIDNYRETMAGMLTPNVPVMMWIQDALGRLICKEAGRSMGPLDFAMGYARKDCVEECEYPGEGFLACDVPTGSGREIAIKDAWRERHACDVSFVSTASKRPEQIHAERRAESPARIVPLIDAIFEKVRSMLREGSHLYFARRLLAETIEQTGVKIEDAQLRRDLETWYVFRLFDWGFRQESLGWVADWARRTGRKFHLYGRGWEAFPGLAEFARGHIWEREEVGAVHQLSRINLQLFAYTALHQRTYDVLGANGLVLFRRTPIDYRDDELTEVRAQIAERGTRGLREPKNRELLERMSRHFEDIEDALDRVEKAGSLEWPRGECASSKHPILRQVTFDCPEVLEALLDKHLADDGVRERTARALRESILPSSTYRARMSEMLEFVSGRLRLRTRYGGREFAPARGPEAQSSARLLVFKSEYRTWHPQQTQRLNEATDKLTAWLRKCSPECEVVSAERIGGLDRRDHVYACLERHEPDLAIFFGAPLLCTEDECGPIQLVMAPDLHGSSLGLPALGNVRFVGLGNYIFPECASRASYCQWTGLASEQVEQTWWPLEAESAGSMGRDSKSADARCDLAVTLMSEAPTAAIIQAWREILTGRTRQLLDPVLGSLSELRDRVLDDPSLATPAGMDAMFDELVGHLAGEETISGELVALRCVGLPRYINSWLQEGWLERLGGWAVDQGYTLRIGAGDLWKEHPTLGRFVAEPCAMNGAVHGRLHLGLGSAAMPSARDMAGIVSGSPTLLWRSPNRIANDRRRSGRDSPIGPPDTLEGLCAEGDRMMFSTWEELTDRVRDHLADSAPLAELTRSVGASVAQQLCPERILGGLLEWALSQGAGKLREI